MRCDYTHSTYYTRKSLYELHKLLCHSIGINNYEVRNIAVDDEVILYPECYIIIVSVYTSS